MKIDFRSKFYGVGQGLFYSAYLNSDQSFNIEVLEYGKSVEVLKTNAFSVVYDVGTLSSKFFLEKSIDDFVRHNRQKTINLCVISHLDEDHFNGLTTLLDKLKSKNIQIDRLVYPKLDKIESAVVYLNSKNKSRSFYKYSFEFEDWIKIKWASVVRGFKNIGYSDNDSSPLRFQLKNEENKIWTFDLLRNDVPSKKVNLEMLLSFDKDSLDKTFKLYKGEFKKLNKNINESSIIFFHTPIEPYKCFPWRLHHRLFQNGLDNTEFATLLTGDCSLKNISDSLLSDRRLAFFLVPHHGSSTGWDYKKIGLIKSNPVVGNIISTGFRYNTPSDKVIKYIDNYSIITFGHSLINQKTFEFN